MLAQRLRDIAGEKQIPLSHVADRCGLARSYLWRLLAAKSSATLSVVERLAEVLGVEPIELLTPRHAHSAAVERRKARRKLSSSNPRQL
jgi:transcriptional regulator with XRE-family HTH domain